MPHYDYHCPANGRTVEVRHSISDDLRTWGELVAAARLDAGDTPLDAEVRRLIRGGNVLRTPSGEREAGSGCGPHCACHGG